MPRLKIVKRKKQAEGPSLQDARDAVVNAWMQTHLANFLSGDRDHCFDPVTKEYFAPRNRWHVFISSDTRKQYYRGQFRTPEALAESRQLEKSLGVGAAAKRKVKHG